MKEKERLFNKMNSTPGVRKIPGLRCQENLTTETSNETPARHHRSQRRFD